MINVIRMEGAHLKILFVLLFIFLIFDRTKLSAGNGLHVDISQNQKKRQLLFAHRFSANTAQCFGSNTEVRSQHMLRYPLSNRRISLYKIIITFFSVGNKRMNNAFI